eukprot:m.88712 g.88712  ORF g.88712 m.88712 type:complete len:777 (-) comp8815_c0_seq2:1478-3808(-)
MDGRFNKTELPERWLYCPKHGSVLNEDIPFVPMKTMLDFKFNKTIPDEELKWTPELMMQTHPDVGLVIDLTKAKRYYRPEEYFNKAGSPLHEKIICDGHGGPPTDEQVQAFIATCNAFFQRTEKDSSLKKQIAVHCTHGFNRTGFMIVSFLCEVRDMQVELALDYFIRARQPGIYKVTYIERLCEKYDGSPDEFLSIEKPPWSFKTPEVAIGVASLKHILHENEGKENDKVVMKQTSDIIRKILEFAKTTDISEILQHHGWIGMRFQNDEIVEPNVLVTQLETLLLEQETADEEGKEDDTMTMPQTQAHGYQTTRDESKFAKPSGLTFEIKNDNVHIVGPPRLGPLRKLCREMCGASEPRAFPGAQPISLLREHLGLINANEYVVSHKADGIRYLMMIRGADVYMVGRDNSFFHISGFSFPSKQTGQLISNALVDGELVRDKTGKHEFRYRFYIFDFIHYETQSFRNIPYMDRLKKADELIIAPRLQHQVDTSKELFGLRRKVFVPFEQFGTPNWKTQIHKQIYHEKDGYMIIKNVHEYLPGSCDFQLKWKYPRMNSIDFFFELVEDNDTTTTVALCVQGPGGLPVRFFEADKSEMSTRTPANRKFLREHNGRIVECRWDSDSSKWAVMLVRSDKTHPNAFQTASRVWKTIKENIVEKELDAKARQLRMELEERKLRQFGAIERTIYKTAQKAIETATMLRELHKQSDNPAKRPKMTYSSIMDDLLRGLKLLADMKKTNALVCCGWDVEKRDFSARVSPEILEVLGKKLMGELPTL